MSEERMIRVHYPVDVYELDSNVRVYVEMRYYNFDGHIQRVGNQKNFDELEPAPSKDWRPFCYDCYDDEGNQHEGCVEADRKTLEDQAGPCQFCPHRRRSENTQSSESGECQK